MRFSKVLIGKKSISYFEKGEGPWVLFLHGWGISPLTYEATLNELSKTFHVVAPFLRIDTSMSHTLVLLNAFLKKKDIEKSIIIGHSSAGIMATLFGQQYSKRVSALVLVDSMGFTKNHAKTYWLFRWMTHVIRLFRPTFIGEDPRFVGLLLRDFLWQVVRYPHSLVIELWFCMRKDITSQMKTLSLPILILWGRDDDLIPYDDVAEDIEKEKNAEIQIVSGDHGWLKKNPHLLRRRIEEFVDTT